MFKANTRTLTADSTGIRTTIGSQSGDIPWKEVVSIRDENRSIVLQRTNGNAFIIPQRAFATPADRQHFLDTVCAWQEAQKTNTNPNQF